MAPPWPERRPYRPLAPARSLPPQTPRCVSPRRASALKVKSVRVAGSTINYAYAVKAGPWVFLNGHEAFDFERGLAAEVEGPPGNRLSGRPPLRREGRLPAAPHARHSQGIRHRSAQCGTR